MVGKRMIWDWSDREVWEYGVINYLLEGGILF